MLPGQRAPAATYKNYGGRVPNVGKSAFINRIAGRASAATGDRPGVTRNKQWVRINPEIQLLDTRDPMAKV